MSLDGSIHSLWHKRGDLAAGLHITSQSFPALTLRVVALFQLLSLASSCAARWPGGRRCRQVGEQRPRSGRFPPRKRSLHVPEVKHQPQVGSWQIQWRRRRNRRWRERNRKQRGKGHLTDDGWIAAASACFREPWQEGRVQRSAGAGGCQGDAEVLSRAPVRSSETIPKLPAIPEFSLPKCGLEQINHLLLDPLVEYIFPKTYLLDWIRSSTGWDPRFSLVCDLIERSVIFLVTGFEDNVDFGLCPS